jgi:hypothetical protein
MAVDKKKEEAILNLVMQARLRADAIIVVGIMPGGAVFFDCDKRITIPDLHGVLQDSTDFICQRVAVARAREINERPTR